MVPTFSRAGYLRAARLAVVTAAALTLAACGFNSVPTKQEAAKAKWADVQAAFQERANLVPNLAAVAKGAAEQEKAILTGVVEARAKATSVQVTANDLNDPAKMQQFQQAQDQFGQSTGAFAGERREVPRSQIDPELSDAADASRRPGEPHPRGYPRL